jgi:hypothetical protein
MDFDYVLTVVLHGDAARKESFVKDFVASSSGSMAQTGDSRSYMRFQRHVGDLAVEHESDSYESSLVVRVNLIEELQLDEHDMTLTGPWGPSHYKYATAHVVITDLDDNPLQDAFDQLPVQQHLQRGRSKGRAGANGSQGFPLLLFVGSGGAHSARGADMQRWTHTVQCTTTQSKTDVCFTGC